MLPYCSQNFLKPYILDNDGGYGGARGQSLTLTEALNGGEIKTQELMVGLQYKF